MLHFLICITVSDPIRFPKQWHSRRNKWLPTMGTYSLSIKEKAEKGQGISSGNRNPFLPSSIWPSKLQFIICLSLEYLYVT